RVAFRYRPHQCDDLVALAAGVWPMARKSAEQIEVLDAVDECSDGFNRRQHFAFVPPEVRLDYERLKLERQVQSTKIELESQQRASRERCESSCMTMYADNGVCMGGCHGNSK